MSRKAPSNTFWRGSVLWGRLKIKGQEHRWSLRTDDAETARARVEAYRRQAIAASHYGDARQLWEDVVTAWGEHIVGQVAPRTVTRYAVSLKQLEPWLRGVYVDAIDKALISEIVRDRRRAGVTTATIRRDLSAVSSVLDYAEDQDWCEGNPALNRQRKLKERRDPIVLPDPKDIERVIVRTPGGLAALIRAAWLTGCRQDELVSAERSRLDHVRRQLTVRGKGSKVRVIDLDYGDAYELLRSRPVRIGCKWLFWHHQGEPYRNVASRFAAIVKGVQKAAQREQAEFRPFRFHDLRHRHAVDWLKSGRNIYDLQQRLGHKSIKTTELYLKYLTPEEARAAKYSEAQIGAHVQRFVTGDGAAGA